MTRNSNSPLHDPTRQHQFLDVIDRDLAESRFQAAISLEPVGHESCPLNVALGRVLAEDVIAMVDVPSFDRSNLDGFAVRASDTVQATEESPITLRLTGEIISTAIVPRQTVAPGWATPIATGGMLPRGADAIMMIEHTESDGDVVQVYRSVAPGKGISFAGTDIGCGEVVLHRGQELTSRETGVLAAIGRHEVQVWRRPVVAIISTGDEIIPPDAAMEPGLVFDSNARILADAVHELGGEPLELGIVNDDVESLRHILRAALKQADVVLLSGGTSKGAGDLSYQVVRELDDPGIVAHGVALKPGKPICLAATARKPVVILPGFPTSAVFTFHEFVAPVIQRLAGRHTKARDQVAARMAVKVNSEIGRTEYLLVGLVQSSQTTGAHRHSAYPMGKGSGSVTTFSRADGFVTIDRHTEIVDADEVVSVQLLGHRLILADLVVIGSHCVGIDLLLGRLHEQGLQSKFLAVGSMGGLTAVGRGECDIAGIHLLDSKTNDYNRPFLSPQMVLAQGYRRQQGILFRKDDARFHGASSVAELLPQLTACQVRMVNRNAGSGTRILIDQLLQGARPDGYSVQTRSHNAVAAAIAQSRADWGVAIRRVAETANLAFLPLADECFDFVIPRDRLSLPVVQTFLTILRAPQTQRQLNALGLATDGSTGQVGD